MSKEYKKSLEDEIDWKIIDQLHTATVNFSATSLELKKIHFVLIGIAVPSIIKLCGDKLDMSLFITLYLLTISFWFLDSFTYFYQEKLRVKMNNLFEHIKERNKGVLIITEKTKRDYTIEETRTETKRVRRSVFNLSNGFYFVFLILNSVAFILFLTGYIK